MKIWIKLAIYAALVSAFITMTALYVSSNRHIKTLKTQVKEQSAIIDSLLARRMTVFDVKLQVTDKSKSVMYGRHNQGTMNMPQERIYILKIDSVNVNMK
jgi:hypothetical protein